MVARTPTTREAIQEGKYEPATVMSAPRPQPVSRTLTAATLAPRSPGRVQRTWSLLIRLTAGGPGRGRPVLARAEGKRHRGVEQLQLRIDFLKAGAAQLAPRGKEIHESPQAEAIGPQGSLVRALRGLDHGGRHVESPEAEAHVRIGLPDVVDCPIASRGDFLLGGSPLSFGELHLAGAGAALEELPFEAQPRSIRELSDAGPGRGGGAEVVLEPGQFAAHVARQEQRREIVGTGTPDGGFLLSHDGNFRDQIGSLLECLVDDLLDGILEVRWQGEGREVDQLERGGGQDAHALGEGHLRVPLLRSDLLQVELRLRGLLPGE